MKPTPSPQDSRWDEEIIKILKQVGSLRVEYPSELFTARRATFILQVQQQDQDDVENALSSTEQLIQHFASLTFTRFDYPPELLAVRRAAFIELVERSKAETPEEVPEDQETLQLFRRLKSAEVEYPSNLMAARRAAFKRQIAVTGRTSVLEVLRTSLRSLFQHRIKMSAMPTVNMMRTSLVITVLMLAIFVGSLLRNQEQAFDSPSPQGEVARPGTLFTVTDTSDVAPVICKPGYTPPLCLAKEFDKSQDLSFVGNGAARPAVAKDTLPGYNEIHDPAYVNDGLYGPGASWISNSPYSWIKIDLGKTTTINTVTFGRDRLGNFNDGDPGQFVIAVALSDNIYADGNSSNDYTEYTEVFNSEQIGFNGTVSGSETINARFGAVTARFVKIIFANAGTAIDEIEVFMDRSPKLTNSPTKKPGESLPGVPAISIANTLAPTKTATPLPTATSFPTRTATSVPTNTPLPTKTSTPVPTDTRVPTDTAMPVPTNTSVPTNTPMPPPTNTPMPPPTKTPVPPPPPTNTPVPPTEPPAELVVPLAVPTEETLVPIEIDGS